MAAEAYVDVFVEPNPNCAEGSERRWKAESEPRPVTALRYWDGPGEPVLCDVAGWSSEGGGSPCPARAVLVEDSGSGAAFLVWGGDWGLRLTPRGGGDPFGEPYLLVAREDLLEYQARAADRAFERATGDE
jgi:hypothetical protein